MYDGSIKRGQIRANGVNKDLPENQLADNQYTDVQNMEPFDAGMQSSKGFEEAFATPLFAPEHILFNEILAVPYWVYMSSAGIGVHNGAAHFNITPAAGVTSTWLTAKWTATVLQGFCYLNNGVDAPVYWYGDTAVIAAALPGWPAATTAGAIRAFQYNLMALNIADASGTRDNQILWSDAAEPNLPPTAWAPLPTNEAGDNELADTLGPLIDGQQLRNQMLLFKGHATYIAQYIGGNFVFAFRKLSAEAGILAENCAVEHLGRVYAITDGDIIRTDGVSLESIINRRIQRWLFAQIDADYYRKSFAVVFYEKNQIWFCFPTSGNQDCNLAVILDVNTGEIGLRDIEPAASHITRGLVGGITGVLDWDSDTQSWDDDSTVWNAALFNPTEDSLLQADRNATKFYALDTANDFNGAVINSKVEKTGLDFGYPDRQKLVSALTPRITGENGTVLSVEVGFANDDGGSVSWKSPVTYTIGSSYRLPVLATGRFIAIKIYSAASQPQWTITGVDFEYEVKGLH